MSRAKGVKSLILIFEQDDEIVDAWKIKLWGKICLLTFERLAGAWPRVADRVAEALQGEGQASEERRHVLAYKDFHLYTTEFSGHRECR